MGDLEPITPTRPSRIPDYADECLQALAAQNLGHRISLGGAFGLLHYLDYRSTYDVDAWWNLETTSAERQQIVAVLKDVLQAHGEVRIRAWGEVVSVELVTGSRKRFSFQIAERTAQLEPSQSAAWTDVLLDSFTDLVASKMVALVERGAPRDFRDIHAVCEAGLVTPKDCWTLWQKRQVMAGSDVNYQRAQLAIATHLSRIEQQRPLAKIQDLTQRSHAETVRLWYKEEFINAVLD